MTDEEFQLAIDKVVAGDKEGLKVIYEAYVRFIYTLVFDVVKNRSDAEDITSEFFIKLIHAANSFRAGSPHKAWLAAIARNQAVDYMRKNRKEVLAVDQTSDDAVNIVENAGETPDSKIVEDKVILAHDMKRAMERLSPREKEILDMKLMGELKFREIAEILNVPLGTVTWIFNQGIIKVRRCLKEYEY